jgi:hypothetical protein
MQSYVTGVKTIFFHPSFTPTPSLVHVFSSLRHGEYRTHPLGYVELCCDTVLDLSMSAQEIASKLTATLSIHLDDFLGLTMVELEHDTVRFCARFSQERTREHVGHILQFKAEDILDTLMAMGE